MSKKPSPVAVAKVMSKLRYRRPTPSEHREFCAIESPYTIARTSRYVFLKNAAGMVSGDTRPYVFARVVDVAANVVWSYGFWRTPKGLVPCDD